jgi:tRNA (uracil-5-)-methyltransferase
MYLIWLDVCALLQEFAQAWRRERSFYRLEGIDLDQYNLQTILVDPPRCALP